MLALLRRVFGLAGAPALAQFATARKLEELCKQDTNVGYGIEPVEIPDPKRLEEFIALKRRASTLWQPKAGKSL